MNTHLLKTIESAQIKNDMTDFTVGDEISVHNIIREGEKTRVQVFRGLVLSQKGSGIRATFTIRKISDGVGVEKIFPLHSPNIEKIVVHKRGNVRRSKIYYMRERQGKSAMKIDSATASQMEKYSQAEEAKAAAAQKELEEAEAAKAAEEAKVKAEAEAAEAKAQEAAKEAAAEATETK